MGGPPDGGRASGPDGACSPSVPPAVSKTRGHLGLGKNMCLLLQAASSRSTRQSATAVRQSTLTHIT